MAFGLNPIDAVKGAGKAIGDVASKGADGFGDVLNGAKKAVSSMSVSDLGHMALDGVGMIPGVGEVADIANAGWYAAEGDYVNAGLSAAAAIPFAGNVATGAKWAKRGVEAVGAVSDIAKTAKTADKALKTADKVVDGARTVEKVVDGAKTTEKAAKAGRTTEKAADAVKTTERAADGAKTTKRAKTADEAADGGKATKAADDGKTAKTKDKKAEGDKADDAGKVAPNATITRTEGKNSFTWKTDSEGRFVSGKAKIKEDFGGGERPQAELDAQGAAAAKGKKGDEGGHMFAYRFTKGQGEVNLVPQNGNLNVGAWKKMENEWADWVNNGKEVNVETSAKRAAGSDRPSSFRVSYEVVDPKSGKVIYENSKPFENAAGQTFDRVSAKDIENWGTGG